MNWLRHLWCLAAHVKVVAPVFYLKGELAGYAWHCSQCKHWFWRGEPYPQGWPAAPESASTTNDEPRLEAARRRWQAFLFATSLIAGVVLVGAVFARPWLEQDEALLRESEWAFLLFDGLILIAASALFRAAMLRSRQALLTDMAGPSENATGESA